MLPVVAVGRRDRSQQRLFVKSVGFTVSKVLAQGCGAR